MIPYVGLPVNPQTAAVKAVAGGHAFVSHDDTHPLGLAVEVCQSFALDNGSFSAWSAKRPIKDWRPFYEWASDCRRIPSCDFAVIPDVIDGTEQENDALIAECPLPRHFAVPVWHMHESMERLARLAAGWPRICIGSSGDFKDVGSADWWRRMAEAMAVLCDDAGRPMVRVHGLRMLDPRIFARVPLASADSTNIARNIGLDKAWRGSYTPPTKEARAAVMRARLEAAPAAVTWVNTLPEAAEWEQAALL